MPHQQIYNLRPKNMSVTFTATSLRVMMGTGPGQWSELAWMIGFYGLIVKASDKVSCN